MATVAGTINDLSNGVFHAKDENGNIRVLKVGDTIYENDTIYGDDTNSSSSKVEILLSGNDVIVLSEGEKQLIDSSLIETAFGTEELFFTRESLNLKADEYNSNADVVSDLRDAEFTAQNQESQNDGSFADANNSDVTEEETAEGEEEVEDETTGTGEFQARDGNATDIESDLRNAQFKARTQVFEDKSFFENESKDRLTSLENTDRPTYTNPPTIPTTPPTPTPPVTPPVTPPTPSIIIGNLSVDDVSSYESEGFLIFTVSLDRSVSSPVTFDYKTSPITATNKGVDYNDVSGKITIPAGSTSITIKVPITDDYLSDNGETMKITISNVVGNANISKPEGIGTILDNPVNNPENGTPNTPKEPGGYEDVDSVYAIITGAITVNEGNTTTYTVKLVDKDGNDIVVTNATEVTVRYTNVTTQDGDTEFNNNNTIIVTIPANGSSNTFTVVSLDDYLSDNGEEYNVAIIKVNTNEFENVVIGDINGNNKDVTTEILDNSKDTPTDPYDQKDIPPVETDLDTITIKLFAIDPVTGARVPANEVLEGNDAEYIAVAFDKNNNEVLQGETVTVTFGKSGDTATNGGVDYVSTTQIVTIGTKFSTATTDDYIADNGEFYSVQILDETLSNASNYETVIIDTTSVTTTILDDSQPNTPNNPNDGIEQDMESVIVKLVSTDALGNIIPEATIPEGEIAYYKAILVDPSGNQIVGATGTVAITFTDGTAIRTGTSDEGKNDFTATNQTVTLNTVFSAVANDDYIADNGETFNVQITDDTYSKASDYENVIHDTTPVVTTITDNSKPVDGNTPHDPNDTPNHTTESNKEIVTIKLFAADSNGNVIKDGSGNYVLANTVNENTDAKYIAYAFNNGETTFTDATRLDTQVGKVDISFHNGSATGVDTTQTTTNGSQDFDNKSQTITIGESFSTKVFNDVLTENAENYTVSIDTGSYAVDTVNGGYESVTIDTTAVTTTINDSIIPMKVFVKIEPVTDIVNESENLKYKLTIVDENGVPVTVPVGENITVELDYSGNTANEADKTNDYTPDTSVTISGGTSSTEFELPTNDDYFAEGDEGLKITIGTITDSNNVFEDIKSHTIANGADSDEDTATGIIKDNPTSDTVNPGTPNEPTDPNEPVDPVDNPPVYGEEDTVYVKITHNDSVIEGNTLTHTVTLVDKNGNPVTVPVGETITVTLVYSDDTTENPDYDGSTKVTEVTILGGSSSVDVENPTIDDFVADNNEVYTLTITDVEQANGTFENVAIHATDDSVTGTILDGITLGTPVNAQVDEDDFDVTDANTTITDTQSLGIQKPNNPDNNYTLSFDNTATKVYQGDFASTTDYGLGNLKAGGQTVNYQTIGNKIIGYIGADVGNGVVADSNKVFEIVLNKDSDIASGTTTKDSYTYTQYKNIDHPIAGDAGIPTNDDDLTFEFGFKITDQGQTSNTVSFKVKVNDSLPINVDRDVEVNEDNSLNIVISPESFKDGEIDIRVNGYDAGNGNDGYITLTNGQSIRITDPNDDSIEIGTLSNNGDGTVTFTPDEDYSNYAAKPWFEYAVSDFDGDTAAGRVNIEVKPVADAPIITISTPTMIEDDTNVNEGTHQVTLGLTRPALSKDQTDKNGVTGDSPERNGEITLTFTNGNSVTGAKIFKADGNTQIGNEITTVNQTLKIVIVTVSGDSNTIDYNYHHADITALNPSDAIYLTKDEYEALKIQHAEDNDTDIRINIKVTSYEVDDTNTPLDIATYGSQVENEASANMTVKIHPATDDISLIWDTAIGGIISQTTIVDDTFTFTAVDEGDLFTTPIDLKSLLTKTSGTETFDGTKADLDGSEKRTYTITGIPEGTIITLGGQAAVANASGEAIIVFNNTNNQAADPEFTMKLPEQYSGEVTGKITLSVQDQGVDSGDTASDTKTAEVYFNVIVNPIADIATIQVKQSVGFEDAGRDGGNTIGKSDVINANGTGGIPLNIKVSSDDKDGSETFNVKIEDIPVNAVIYYDGVVVNQLPAGTITIEDFDNAKSLIFIPPHNDDSDYILKVSSQTVDNNGLTIDTSAWSSTKDIEVIVKNVADAPVGTDLNANININEDNQLNLQDIYTTPANLASYDDSEELTVKIDLPSGFTIDSGSPYYIEDGMYVVKASDIRDGNIKINVPENFSGSAEIDLTYVTTEKAGEGDSKTWDTQTVNFFINPIADDVAVATSSTIYEDVDGGTNKINLTPSLVDNDGSESITSVKILASTVPVGYELYLDSDMTQSISSTLNGLYYELTPAEADSIYAKNTTLNDADSSDNFDLTVVYSVKDEISGEIDTADFTHTHTVNVQAVTDTPSLSVGIITQELGDVTINGTTVTVNQEDSQFKVPVTTTSPDTDGSETVQKIVITGVPMGVEVIGATYYGYSGSEHNGIWVITAPTDSTLDGNGALEDIIFKINQGADFDSRDITITTYTQDVNAEIKSASQTIHIEKTYTPGIQPGTPADLELAVKTADITEDTEFDLANLLEVNLKSGGSQGNGGAVITITDIPEGSTITGYDYSYVDAGKTYYVVVGNGNATDMNTQLSDVKITTPKDMNSSQEGSLQGDFTFTANIATYHNGGFNEGNVVTTSTQTILPLTDEMTISIDANNILEDGTTPLTITLSNPNDGTKTELIGNSITIEVTENWADVVTGGGITGTLTDTSGKYNVVDNNDGTYTITPILPSDNFTVGTPITGLQYTSASNRDGSVNFEVSVQNKETGSVVTLNSTGTTNISVTPVIDVVLNASVVTANGTEDMAVIVGGTTLANPVKLEITAGTFTDGSEKLGNIILDEVPNGFTVWYIDNGNLVMAINIGTTGGGTFDLTPNIDSDTDVTRNKWMIPASANGTMPEVYINAPTNWSGEFDFKTKFNISEQNLSAVTPITVDVTGKIEAVADGVTIDPTLTFGDAFSWVSLNLNANMKDVDGSETMSLELTGLNESAQFQLANGAAVNATLDGTIWKLEGITYDQINNIQFAHDKSVVSVGVIANTIEIDNLDEGTPTIEKGFELKLSDVSGSFKLDEGLSLDFDKIASLSSSNTLKNVSTIDLTQVGENKLENITLQDVLDMTDSNNTLKITGDNEDSVSFTGAGWSKTAGAGADSGFDVYSNSNDTSVKVKVQTEISDGITN